MALQKLGDVNPYHRVTQPGDMVRRNGMAFTAAEAAHFQAQIDAERGPIRDARAFIAECLTRGGIRQPDYRQRLVNGLHRIAEARGILTDRAALAALVTDETRATHEMNEELDRMTQKNKAATADLTPNPDVQGALMAPASLASKIDSDGTLALIDWLAAPLNERDTVPLYIAGRRVLKAFLNAGGDLRVTVAGEMQARTMPNDTRASATPLPVSTKDTAEPASTLTRLNALVGEAETAPEDLPDEAPKTAPWLLEPGRAAKFQGWVEGQIVGLVAGDQVARFVLSTLGVETLADYTGSADEARAAIAARVTELQAAAPAKTATVPLTAPARERIEALAGETFGANDDSLIPPPSPAAPNTRLNSNGHTPEPPAPPMGAPQMWIADETALTKFMVWAQGEAEARGIAGDQIVPLMKRALKTEQLIGYKGDKAAAAAAIRAEFDKAANGAKPPAQTASARSKWLEPTRVVGRLATYTTLTGVPLAEISQALDAKFDAKDYKDVRLEGGRKGTDIAGNSVRNRFDRVFGPHGLGWRMRPLDPANAMTTRAEIREKRDAKTGEIITRTWYIATATNWEFEYCLVDANGENERWAKMSAMTDTHESMDAGYATRGVMTSLMKQALRGMGGYTHLHKDPSFGG